MSHLTIIGMNRIPPGGWRYKSQHSGVLITAADRYELYRKVHDHEQANGYPLTPDADIMHQCCLNAPPELCTYLDGNPSPVGAEHCTITADQMLAGAEAVAKLLYEVVVPWADPWVDQAEADRRAFICARCPKNIAGGGCSSCGTMAAARALVDKVKGGRSTPHDRQLQTCCVCGCACASIVWVRLDILETGMTERMVQVSPDWCWKATGLKAQSAAASA